MFPDALVCADHFHVIKNLSTFFNNARVRIMKKYEHLKPSDDNYYWLYKKILETTFKESR
jgi:transposase